MRHRFRKDIQGHTFSKPQNQNLKPGPLAPEPIISLLYRGLGDWFRLTQLVTSQDWDLNRGCLSSNTVFSSLDQAGHKLSELQETFEIIYFPTLLFYKLGNWGPERESGFGIIIV